MEKVLSQAEILAEAILESEEYIAMRLAEQAAMRNEECTNLFADYTEKRKEVENILSDPNMDPAKLSKAGEELENIEKAINDNSIIAHMRETGSNFSAMMEQVNRIIKRTVTGEDDEETSGCTGSCESCGGACHRQ